MPCRVEVTLNVRARYSRQLTVSDCYDVIEALSTSATRKIARRLGASSVAEAAFDDVDARSGGYRRKPVSKFAVVVAAMISDEGIPDLALLAGRPYRANVLVNCAFAHMDARCQRSSVPGLIRSRTYSPMAGQPRQEEPNQSGRRGRMRVGRRNGASR